jgi:hypothetical protein
MSLIDAHRSRSDLFLAQSESESQEPRAKSQESRVKSQGLNGKQEQIPEDLRQLRIAENYHLANGLGAG